MIWYLYGSIIEARFLLFLLHCGEPVSYTHLDVYKRQLVPILSLPVFLSGEVHMFCWLTIIIVASCWLLVFQVGCIVCDCGVCVSCLLYTSPCCVVLVPPQLSVIVLLVHVSTNSSYCNCTRFVTAHVFTTFTT